MGLARNPLGIIALFIVLVYGFASIVVSFSKNLRPDDLTPLISFLVLFPVLVLIVFTWLVSKHHHKLYGPAEYQKQELFTLTFPKPEKGALGDPSDHGPFKLSDHISPSDIEAIDMAQERWYEFISPIPAENLLILYARYNEKNSHSLALETSALAIAKGSNSSKNYSFASASLRKLGRNVEAKGFASLALEQDKTNIDADYNLALIYKSMGDFSNATLHAKIVLSKSDNLHYIKRIEQEFPDLQDNRNLEDLSTK